MGKKQKTALQKKKGRSKKKKWRAAEGRNEKSALQKKKGSQKKNEGQSPSKTEEKKGALHSNKPNLIQYLFFISSMTSSLLCKMFIVG